MKFKINQRATPKLSKKEQFIEFAAVGLGVLILLASAIKVLFI
ncbi:MAG: hypothetical protein ACI8P3_001447 [Saprospiraceae bacterium]|jgi:hypothetical protein